MIFLAAAVAFLSAQDDTFLIRGASIHPITGPLVENASLLVKDGKIAEIAPKIATPKGLKIVDARGLHLYPGFIDSSTEIGLSEISAVRETDDTTEIGDFKPQLRTAIAVNPSSEHVPVIRANGITAALVLPAGGIIAGQASLMHLDGWTWEEMEIRRDAAMVLNFPAPARSGSGPPRPYSELKRESDRRLKLLDAYIENARRYQKAKIAGAPTFRTDLALESMLPVLELKVPLMVTAVRERAVRDAIAWADRQRVRIVISGLRRPGNTLETLKAKNVPVILGPTQALPLDEDDPYDSPFTLASELYRAGVKFAFGTFGNQFSRNLPYQAATAAAFGLPPEEALKAITVNPAQIWGVNNTMGSIEPGKWADILLTDGDPLEVRTQVKRMFIKGREVDLESKHTRLYRKYLARP